MGAEVIEDAASSVLHVKGALTFSTVMALLSQGEAFIMRQRECVIDLRDVIHCETCGIALLLNWLRFANTRGIPLRIQHPPDQTQRLAAVHGAADILFKNKS